MENAGSPWVAPCGTNLKFRDNAHNWIWMFTDVWMEGSWVLWLQQSQASLHQLNRAQHCVGTVHLKHKAEFWFSIDDYVVWEMGQDLEILGFQSHFFPQGKTEAEHLWVMKPWLQMKPGCHLPKDKLLPQGSGKWQENHERGKKSPWQSGWRDDNIACSMNQNGGNHYFKVFWQALHFFFLTRTLLLWRDVV